MSENQDTNDLKTPAEKRAPRATHTAREERLQRFTLTIAMLAVVLGLVGTALAGWLLMIGLRAEPVASQAQFDALNQQVEQQMSRLERQLAAVETAQQPAADHQSRIVSLDGRVDELMQRQAALAGFVNSGAEIHGLARAEALLAIAQDRAQLSGDLDVALAASQRALRQLETIGDDRLAPAMVTLADEIALLEQATEASDRGAAAAALRAVQGVVPRMPLRNRDLGESGPEATPAADDATWYQRLWSGVTRGLSGVFIIRRSDTELRPLLAPEESWFLRRNLELTLTGARLALVDGDTEAYMAAVNDATEWMHVYFDDEDERVSQALNTLERVTSVLSGDPAANIGRALELLRQHGTSETR